MEFIIHSDIVVNYMARTYEFVVGSGFTAGG